MKKIVLYYVSIFILIISYFASCQYELKDDRRGGQNGGLRSNFMVENNKDNKQNKISDDGEGKNGKTTSKSLESTTTTTTTTKSLESTTTTEEKTPTKETSDTTIHTTTEVETTVAPCPECPTCSTDFALGTFFFGNFFGMALMLVLGYIYLSWLRRTSSVPQTARLY